MATVTLKITEQNTTPPFDVTCKRDGVVINLTTASLVELIISKNGVQTNAGHEACTVTDAANGVVEYVPEATDLVGAAKFTCDVEITYNNGKNEVLYDQLKIKTRKRLTRS